MIKPPIVETESRAIPVAITRYVDARDGGRCTVDGCECTTGLQYDHDPAWHLLEPKRHDPDRIFLMCEAHHREKSKTDTTTAAKWKRAGAKDRGEWRKTKNPIKSRSNLQSRGFPKGPKRKLLSRGFQSRKKPQ